MYRSLSILFVAALLCFVSLSLQAGGVHKWVDTKGVTHYSDMAPVSSETQVSLIEIPAAYSTTADIEDDYYSITNQWMRIHEERIAREKIKLEKAKQKAAQRPVAPQVVYVNEPDENRYVVAYPYFFHRKHGHHRFHHKSNQQHGDKHAKHHRREHPDKLQGQDRRHSSQLHRKTSGLTLEIH